MNGAVALEIIGDELAKALAAEFDPRPRRKAPGRQPEPRSKRVHEAPRRLLRALLAPS